MIAADGKDKMRSWRAAFLMSGCNGHAWPFCRSRPLTVAWLPAWAVLKESRPGLYFQGTGTLALGRQLIRRGGRFFEVRTRKIQMHLANSTENVIHERGNRTGYRNGNPHARPW